MFALQFTEYGGPEVLSIGEAPEPHAGPGQIRIVVRAASVNRFDGKVLSGMLAQGKPLEGTGYLGFDAAGVVDEVGDGVTGVAVGDDLRRLDGAERLEHLLQGAAVHVVGQVAHVQLLTHRTLQREKTATRMGGEAGCSR